MSEQSSTDVLQELWESWGLPAVKKGLRQLVLEKTYFMTEDELTELMTEQKQVESTIVQKQNKDTYDRAMAVLVILDKMINSLGNRLPQNWLFTIEEQKILNEIQLGHSPRFKN